MAKTIAIALAITASLVGSESFAGQPRPLMPGQSVTLEHTHHHSSWPTGAPRRRIAEERRSILPGGERRRRNLNAAGRFADRPSFPRLQLEIGSGSILAWPSIDSDASNSGNINPQPGKFSTVGLPFTAIDRRKWMEIAGTISMSQTPVGIRPH